MKEQDNNSTNFVSEMAILRRENPWRVFVSYCSEYMPYEFEQFQDFKWLYAACDMKDIGKYVAKYNNKKERISTNCFYFNLDPQPWIGKWNVDKEEDLPELVILSLNPGIGYFNFIVKECESYCTLKRNGEYYYDLMLRSFTGKVASSEMLLNPIWQHYNGYYWLEKLYEIFDENKEELLFQRKYSSRLYRNFDKIMFMDICPYHSIGSNAFCNLVLKGQKPLFESMNFTKKLVEMFMNYGRKIIVARGSSHWIKLVGGLETYGNCYKLSSSQNTSITKGNIIRCSHQLQDEREKAYEEIKSIFLD